MLKQILGLVHINNKNEEIDIYVKQNILYGLYFSASWCRASFSFTNKLINFYNQINKDEKQFEIILISKDSNINEFNDYFQKMPWVSIKFDDKNSSQNLIKIFRPKEIPHLFIVDNQGKLISDNAIQDINYFGIDAFFIWKDQQ